MKIRTRSTTTVLASLWLAAAMLPGTLFAEATPRNVALGGTIAAFSSRVDSSYKAEKIIDGVSDKTDNRWTAAGYPQWVEIDLGVECNITKTIVHTQDARAYQFKVESRTEDGEYATIVDRLNNQTGGPITDAFEMVTARFVKITVNGAFNYTGDRVSLHEFEIHGIPLLTQDTNIHIKGITRIDGGLDLVGQGLAIYATKEEYENGGQPVFEVTAEGTMFVTPQGDISMGPYGAGN